MKILSLIITLLSISIVGHGQRSLAIDECLQLEGFNFNDYNQADRMPMDTLIDVKNGYFEISDYDTKLLQATKYKNKDKSILIVATGFYADMQCSNFFTNFYLKKASENTLKSIDQDSLLPNLNFTDFFVGDSIPALTQKYLSEIQEAYYPGATLENVYEEFYDFHFILPRFGTEIIVQLTVCDYIPTNTVNIDLKDWEVINNKLTSITLSYDKTEQRFYKK